MRASLSKKTLLFSILVFFVLGLLFSPFDTEVARAATITEPPPTTEPLVPDYTNPEQSTWETTSGTAGSIDAAAAESIFNLQATQEQTAAAQAAVAQGEAAAARAAAAEATGKSAEGFAVKAPEGIKCGLTQMDGCIALLSYYLFVGMGSFFIWVGGGIFDAMVAFSLDVKFMNPDFVNEGWTAVRNIANMTFIFVLLYIAIATILSLGEYKKLLINLIVVALVINFSAFFTKVVIDASNIVALGFYDAISASAGTHIQEGTLAERRISEVLMGGFDLQNIEGSDSFKKWKEEGESFAMLFFVFLAAGITMMAAAFTFFMAGFLFLGRTVAFWFLIIASPLAFVAFILPGMKGQFDKWWSTLIEQALVAPVFLFFMYIISLITSGDWLKGIFTDDAANSTEDLMMNIILYFTALLIAFIMAYDVTKNLSGKAGAMATKVAGGAAVGSAAFVGRKTVGKVASKIADTDAMKNWAARSRMGARTLEGVRGVSKASFDLRTAPYAAELGGGGLGKAGGSGGYEATRQKRIKARQAFAESLGEKEVETVDAATGKVTVRRVKRSEEYAERLRDTEPEAAEAIGQFKDRKFNAKIDTEIEQYKTGNDHAGKNRAMISAQQDLDKLNQAFARAKADKLDTIGIETEIKAARATLHERTEALEAVQKEIKELESNKKKIGAKEKSVKDQIKEALKEGEKKSE